MNIDVKLLHSVAAQFGAQNTKFTEIQQWILVKSEKKREYRMQREKKKTDNEEKKYCPNRCNKPIKIIYVNAIEWESLVI